MPSIVLPHIDSEPENLNRNHDEHVLQLKAHLPNGFTLRIVAPYELEPDPVAELYEEVVPIHTDYRGYATIVRLVQLGLMTNHGCAPDGHRIYQFTETNL